MIGFANSSSLLLANSHLLQKESKILFDNDELQSLQANVVMPCAFAPFLLIAS
jgi:hypothetical protein